jgi:hypothetical protein
MQVAFAEAASAFGFCFEPGFVARGCVTVGLVHCFGAQRGTLIFDVDRAPSSDVLEGLRSEEYFCSLLSGAYERFDEALFRGTLNDWGYFGPAELRPSWYTGEQWD